MSQGFKGVFFDPQQIEELTFRQLTALTKSMRGDRK